MSVKRSAVLVSASLMVLTACGSGGSGGSASHDPQAVPSTRGDGETLTVWVMEGDYAGVTTVPTTYAELTAALDTIAAANTADDFSPFYFPGEYWHGAMQWVWDSDAEIAVNEDGEWVSGMDSEEAQQGLTAFQEFVTTYSTKASATADPASPDINQVFASGKTSAILNTNGALSLIRANNEAMTDDALGTFPMPGLSGENQPVVLGGSDWGIAAKSEHQELALQWVKIAASEEIQSEYVYQVDGWIPNSKEGIETAQQTLAEIDRAFFTAALTSQSTPSSGNWATLEGDASLNSLFSAIAAESKTVSEAATEFAEHANEILNK